MVDVDGKERGKQQPGARCRQRTGKDRPQTLPAVREGEIQKGKQRRKKQKRIKLQMLQQKRKHARQRQSLPGQKREKPLPEHMKKKRQNQSQYK